MPKAHWIPCHFALVFFALSGVLANAGAATAGTEKHWSAPGGSLVAVVTTFAPSQNADHLNWDVVAIHDRAHRVIASISLEKGSGITHAVVDDAVWSPDSRFFCFETASSGGHSAWHQPTYVFDAKTSRIYSIDDTIGAITSDNSPLHFTRRDVLHIALYNFNQEKDSDPFCFPKDLDLPKFVKTAQIALHSKGR
jgi:hypothetical protein